MEHFLTSSTAVALEYRLWLNKEIYGSNKKIANPFWMKAWDDFMVSSEIKNFQLFLSTATGKKWLKSEFGQMYQAWQNG